MCGRWSRRAAVLYLSRVPVYLLPLFPLPLVLFPGAPLPLHIFEPRYKEMIAECLENKKPFGMVRAKENAVAEVGCSAVILNVMKRYEDGRMDISTARARPCRSTESQ